MSEKKFDWRLFSLFLFMLVIIAGIAGAGYLQFATVNRPLTQQIVDLREKAEADQTTINTLQQSVATLEQSAQRTQTLSDKQEQVMAEWQSAQKGNLDKWYVAEAQYLVKLADEQLSFNQNMSSALTLLQRADQILQNVQDTRLADLRKSLTADITRLQAAPQLDTNALYTQLTMVSQQLTQLPLPATPLKQEAQPAPTTAPADESWWQTGLTRTWHALRQLIVIHYNGANALPLVLPEEKPFLYQNLQAQLETAKWAVLHRNAVVYQTSLAQAMVWVRQYFVQTAPTTQAVLQQLEALHRVAIQAPETNLSTTLHYFESYLAQPAASQPAAVS